MKEHPILFSTEMVKAILAGQKTQTRRVVKLRNGDTVGNISESGKVLEWIICDKDGDEVPLEFACPYGSTGDRLWVRETFAPEQMASGKTNIVYRADGVNPPTYIMANGKEIPTLWKPSIFMPRWASRITLEITGIKVERVQDITPEDCFAEGIENVGDGVGRLGDTWSMATSLYASLWNKINGKKYPWKDNSWVWAISFKRIDK